MHSDLSLDVQVLHGSRGTKQVHAPDKYRNEECFRPKNNQATGREILSLSVMLQECSCKGDVVSRQTCHKEGPGTCSNANHPREVFIWQFTPWDKFKRYMKTNFAIWIKSWQKNKEERIVYGYIKISQKQSQESFWDIPMYVNVYLCGYTYINMHVLLLYILYIMLLNI